MTHNPNIIGNIPPQVDNLSFCDLITHCEVRELAARTGSAVASFFTYLIVAIYEGLVWFCEAFDRLVTCEICNEEVEIPDPLPPLPPPVRAVDRPPNAGQIPLLRNQPRNGANIDPAPFNANRGQFDLNDMANYQIDEDSDQEDIVPVRRGPQLVPRNRPMIIPNLYDVAGFLGRVINAGQNLHIDDDEVVYDHLDEEAPMLAAATVKEEAPTEAVAEQRRTAALERLNQLSQKVEFDCPGPIMHFDLDAVLKRYKSDQPPAKLLEKYDYAMPDRTKREAFRRVLNGFTEQNNTTYIAVRNLLSKIHYILEAKKDRIEKLPHGEKDSAETALKQEIQHVITRLLDANHDCIDQTLSQLEDIAIQVIASENPLNKISAVSLLQYKAAHALFQHRSDLIKEILVADPDLRDPETAPHMADIEREVKKQVAEAMGMKGNILQVGAQFSNIDDVKRQADKAAKRALPLFFDRYKPVEYLQEQCRVTWGASKITKGLRNALLEWATTYYGLDGEDALSKAVSKDPEALELLCTIAAVELTLPGSQLFLEAAGIIQIK